MSAIQTTVADRSVGFAGQLWDTGDQETSPFTVEGAGEVPFGTLVVRGTADNQGKRPAAQADVAYAKVMGVSVHSHAYAKDNELGDLGLKQYVVGKVLTEGRIRVYTSEAVATTDNVRVRADTNAASDELTGPGTFCKSSSAGHTVLISKGARWAEGTTGAGIAVLEFDVLALTLASD